MAWLKARFFEETTWAGLIVILSAIAGYFNPELAKEITTIGGVIVGAIFVKRNDSPKLDTSGGTVTLKKPPAA